MQRLKLALSIGWVSHPIRRRSDIQCIPGGGNGRYALSFGQLPFCVNVHQEKPIPITSISPVVLGTKGAGEWEAAPAGRFQW